MTFQEKYDSSDRWFEKIIIMEIFHDLMCLKFNGEWTVSRTATELNVSVGLASENLKLARLFHVKPKLMNCETRADALYKVGKI